MKCVFWAISHLYMVIADKTSASVITAILTCNTISTLQNTIIVQSELKVDEQSSVENRNALYPT